MSKGKIIVLDNLQNLYKALNLVLKRFGYEVLFNSSETTALHILQKDEDISLVVVRNELSGLSGVELTRALRKLRPDVAVIIIADNASEVTLPPINGIAPVKLVGEPLELGPLITMIDKYTKALQKESIEPTMLTGLTLPAETFFAIKDISETGCCLRSLFDLDVNYIVILHSADLAQRLKLPADTAFPVRVSNTRPADSGKGYDSGAQFIGLQGSDKANLRAACLSVKGFKVTGGRK